MLHSPYLPPGACVSSERNGAGLNGSRKQTGTAQTGAGQGQGKGKEQGKEQKKDQEPPVLNCSSASTQTANSIMTQVLEVKVTTVEVKVLSFQGVRMAMEQNIEEVHL